MEKGDSVHYGLLAYCLGFLGLGRSCSKFVACHGPTTKEPKICWRATRDSALKRLRESQSIQHPPLPPQPPPPKGSAHFYIHSVGNLVRLLQKRAARLGYKQRGASNWHMGHHILSIQSVSQKTREATLNKGFPMLGSSSWLGFRGSMLNSVCPSFRIRRLPAFWKSRCSRQILVSSAPSAESGLRLHAFKQKAADSREELAVISGLGNVKVQ